MQKKRDNGDEEGAYTLPTPSFYSLLTKSSLYPPHRGARRRLTKSECNSPDVRPQAQARVPPRVT